MPQHLDTATLSLYLDDGLDPEDRATAARHLSGCVDCRQELAELRATVALLGDLPQYRPRRSFQLSAEHARAARPGFFARLLPVLPALRAASAAVALLLVVVGAGDYWTRDDEAPPRSGQEALDSGRDAASDDAARDAESGGAAIEAVDPDDAPEAVPGTESASTALNEAEGDAVLLPAEDAVDLPQGAADAPSGTDAALAAPPSAGNDPDQAAAGAGAADTDDELARDGPAPVGERAGLSATTPAPRPSGGGAALPSASASENEAGQGDGSARSGTTTGGRMWWRVAEVGLGALLVGLVVVVVRLGRMRRDIA